MFQAGKKDRPYTVIAGCAGFGAALAGLLSAKGENVLVIARSREAFPPAEPAFSGPVLEGDCADLDILARAGLERADTVVAAASDDNANLLVAQLTREIFGVKRVIALLNDPRRECVYRELDVPAFSPALLSARELVKGFPAEGKAEAV